MSDQTTSDGNAHTVIQHPDGSTEVVTAFISARIWPNGSVTTNLKGEIKAITLENIVHVRSYRLMRLDGLTVHNIEFDDGGTVDLRYTDSGKLVAFSGNQIGLQVSPQGVITLKRYPDHSAG